MNASCCLGSVESAKKARNVLLSMPSFNVLGILLQAMTKQDLVDVFVHTLTSHGRCVIANHNMHSLYFWSVVPTMREYYSMADYIHIDGMPLIWLGRLFGAHFKGKHRTTHLDLLPSLLEEARKRQWRLFYLGSRPGVAARGARLLEAQYPGLQLVTRDGYFDPTRDGADNQRVLEEIRCYAPDILMVGMGMPRQEIWTAENVKDIPAHAILCCGGLMDLVAGEIPTAPRWLGPLGLEWLFRLLSRPASVWRRYLLEPWLIVFRLATNFARTGRLSVGPLERL